MKIEPKFSGVVTALVTPFLKDKIDYASVKKLLRHQLDNGVEGLVINGTTGESPTLDWSEVDKLFKFVRKESDGAVPLIIGTGTNATKSTIFLTGLAAKLKADAALVVCPYYNKPSQQGVIAHYQELAKNAKLPLILYNVPGRTVINMSAETTIHLSKNKNIFGIKEASGDLEKGKVLAGQLPKNFLLTSGDDTSCVELMLNGGHGVISVISHIIPKEIRKISDLARRGDVTARKEYQKYNELNKMLSIEPNPVPVKMMLYLMGLIRSPELRLPLLAAHGENKTLIQKTLQKLGKI